jgi:hypothetical protein
MTDSDGTPVGYSLADGLSRYDLVLLAIPLAFLSGLVASGLSSVPVERALGLASAVGATAVADALFFNPPTAS